MQGKKLTRKQAGLIIGGFSALCIAGVAGWFFLSQKEPPAPKPRPMLTRKAPVAAATRQQQNSENRKEKTAPAVVPAPAPVASDSTLGDLTRLRGLKRVLQQEAEIADLRKRLAEAQQPVVATPMPQPTIKLPPLDEEKKKPGRRSGPSVISVRGVGDRLSADIRTSDGRIVTVKHGERFNGGTLVVSRKGVSVRKSGDLTRIPFE